MDTWLKVELSEGKDPVVPLATEFVALYLHPRDKCVRWESDIGSFDIDERDGIVWESAFGFWSVFDGLPLTDILKEFDVYFCAVPPLKNRRFPYSMATQ